MNALSTALVDLARSPRIDKAGYARIRRNSGLVHVEVAEKALGKKLPPGAEIHHWNEVRSDNRPENLVICPSSAYHKLIHQRMRALQACGNPNWLKCAYCHQYDDPKNMRQWKVRRSSTWHAKCSVEYNRAWARRRNLVIA